MRGGLLPLLLLLAAMPLCSGLSYGPSVIRVERTWYMGGSSNYTFEGMIAVNDSNQRVVSIETDPPMRLVNDTAGGLRVHYEGNATTLRAVATVDVDFETAIASDPQRARHPPLNTTGLTRWNAGIAAAAMGQAGDTQLETVLNVERFVHGYMTYNSSYFGKALSASEAFAEGQGVCVEYTHLTISMLRYLGMDARFVSGYVNGGEWQPHAWAEVYVQDYGWLPVDSTFGEIGMLDDSHMAFARGADQNGTYDWIRGNTLISDSNRAQFVNLAPDAKNRSISYAFDAGARVLNVTLFNDRQDYTFGSYSVLLPEGTGVNESTVLLLAPGEKSVRSYRLNESMFQPGYQYILPFMASLDDAKLSGDLVVSSQAGCQNCGEAPQAQACPAGIAALLFAGAGAAFHGTRANGRSDG